nr:MAG TPA: bifunctional HTH-domain containing protein/aminotransferase [Caudoviricetes sp.]
MNEQKEACYKRIRQAMELRGIKAVDLVQATGLGKSAISQYISGKYEPKQVAIHKIAKALNVSEAWLMGYDVPIQRAEEIKTVVSKEENELLDMYHKLDALDKKELFKWIAYRLTDEKYDVKKELSNA